MNRVAGRAGIVVVIVLLLLGGFGFFAAEYISNAPQWVTFPGSPHVYNGGNIGCGVVTDRDGVLLLDTTNGRNYSSDLQLRMSSVHWVGDRKGSVDAPALSQYASQMSGYDLLNGVYAYGQTGGIAELTLSARAQSAALKALDGRKGTIGIYNYRTGELICAVTSPTYDPDNVPDLEADISGAYEGMYLNRFIQSAYIPGSIFKIVTLAAALEEIPDIQEQNFTCEGSYRIGSDEIVCTGTHYNQTLKEAFCNSCNCAFAQISQQLGAETLSRYVAKFGIVESLAFDGITTTKGNFDLTGATQSQVAWSSIGQYTDQVNPCRYMAFLGAIANGGRGVVPHLVERITVDGVKTYSADSVREDRIMSTRTAEILAEYLGNNVVTKYGAGNFPGLQVCAKTGTAEVGGDKKPNAMLTGFVLDNDCPLAFIVSVEDGGYGASVCIPILSDVLAVCKNVVS